jgi:hypothetical protein
VSVGRAEEIQWSAREAPGRVGRVMSVPALWRLRLADFVETRDRSPSLSRSELIVPFGTCLAVSLVAAGTMFIRSRLRKGPIARGTFLG